MGKGVTLTAAEVEELKKLLKNLTLGIKIEVKQWQTVARYEYSTLYMESDIDVINHGNCTAIL